MENLKNNIDDITKGGSNLVNDYLKLFGIRQTERLATFLGVISSIFLISVLLLIVIVFGSFVLADFLNNVFESKYMGFLIVGVTYLIIIALLLLKIQRTGRPLFNNLFVKFVLPLFNIEISQEPNIKGLRKEKNLVKEHIENEKKMINAHTQLLRYAIFEDFLSVFSGLFKAKSKRKTKKKKINKTDS